MHELVSRKWFRKHICRVFLHVNILHFNDLVNANSRKWFPEHICRVFLRINILHFNDLVNANGVIFDFSVVGPTMLNMILKPQPYYP